MMGTLFDPALPRDRRVHGVGAQVEHLLDRNQPHRVAGRGLDPLQVGARTGALAQLVGHAAEKC
jgi:hypothetical protein